MQEKQNYISETDERPKKTKKKNIKIKLTN